MGSPAARRPVGFSSRLKGDEMNLIELDAREFGLHLGQGGWRLGLLVARNVENNGRGRPKKNDRSFSEKATAAEFAKLAATSRPRVLRFLEAWERAAEDGVVPPSSELSPGEELDWLDVEQLPPWGDYYGASKAGGFQGGKERVPTPGVIGSAVERMTPEEQVQVARQILAKPKARQAFAEDKDAEAELTRASGDVFARVARDAKAAARTAFPRDTNTEELMTILTRLSHARSAVVKTYEDLQDIVLTPLDREKVLRFFEYLDSAVDMLGAFLSGEAVDFSELLQPQEED